MSESFPGVCQPSSCSDDISDDIDDNISDLNDKVTIYFLIALTKE